MSTSLEQKKARLRGIVEMMPKPAAFPAVEPRHDRQELEPLSFAQEGLWFVWQLEGPNPAYNNSVVVRFSGLLDVEALNRAISTIVRRHASLRTRFVERAGVPYQIVADTMDVRLEPRTVTAGEAETVYESEARRPFEIGAASLFRTTLYRETTERSVLVVSMHHSISDARSIAVFLRELRMLYDAYRTGEEPVLSAPAVTYTDYVHWQRAWLAAGTLERQLAYWKEQLRDLPIRPVVPVDRPASALPSSRGGTVTFQVPAELRDRLTALSTANHCSLFITLVGALAVLLHRYSSKRDLAVAMGVSNRRGAELDYLIGYFVNTVLLRIGVSPEQTFVSVLETARQVVLDALANQDVPYHRVVEELRPARSAGAAQLFQVMFTMQNVAFDLQAEPSLFTVELPSSGAAKADLSFSVQEGPDGLQGQIEYRADLFEHQSVQTLAERYVRLLQQIAAKPELEAGRYDLLAEAERRLLVEDWSGLDHVKKPEQSIHRAFEERVRENPMAVALVHEECSLTYAELNARANARALQLRALGVERGTLVGVWLPRDPELVISFLAVLKAGGAYVPLKPDYPVERLHAVLRDAQVNVLITATSMLGAVPRGIEHVVLVDGPAEDMEPLAVSADELEGEQSDPRALAYVIYTSGSTGQPKGVVIEHRGVTRLVREVEYMELDASTVALLHSPISFDASTFELWAPLLNGGRLVLARGDSADVVSLAEQVLHHGVNSLWLSAGVLPLWASQPECRSVRLRYLVLGGDAVSEQHVREIYEHDPDVIAVNAYGPTEGTVFCTWYSVPRVPLAVPSLPIGRPMRGSTAYVLDDYMQLQPIGCVGELYVGGSGLARYYLNRPEQTAYAFVPNPFSSDPGDRLYRTGDRVRWLPCGEIEFFGRIDNQVKIRGHRVELGEVEFRLMQLPDVHLAAVTTREDAVGKRLVGYVVPKAAVASGLGSAEERAQWIHRCRALLRQALPEYMVPSTIVYCEALPLTEHGKIDRRRLPDPREEDREQEEYRGPRDEMEHALCAIWEEVLQLGRVGIYDSFFDLGGHSLLATKLASLVRDRLHRRLPLDQLMQHPTVAELATYLAGSGSAAEHLEPAVPDETHRHKPFAMTGVQQAYWLGRSGAFELGNISTHAYVEFELDGLDLTRFERAWNALVRRHDMLRAVFAPDATQRILPEVDWYAIACEDLRGHSAATVEERLQQIRDQLSHHIFDATAWPLFDVRATRVTDRRVRLHFSMDGLPVDAMSSTIIVRELDLLYQDPAATLPELTVSFRDYVLAMEKVKSSELYRRAEEYWMQRARTLPPPPELPLAKDPGAVVQPRFGRRYHVFDVATWTNLQQRAKEAGVTPSALLVSAFGRVLGRWSRNRHFTLNLTLFNRFPLHPQTDELVGDFTSLIPLEIDGRERRPLSDFARDVQSRLWSDMEHRYYGGVEVMRLLNRQSSSGRPTLLPVVFTSTLGFAGTERAASAGPFARALADVSAEGSFGITQTSQVWLDNVVSEAGGRLTIVWDALEELFPEGVLDAMFAAYRSLLDGLAAGTLRLNETCDPSLPEQQLSTRRMVNATDTEVPDGLLQDLFIEQTRHQPSAPAIVQGDMVLSYGELHHHAALLAHALRARSICRNELVAVVMRKGWEQVAAVLGVLYAGAAYLPIDAALPPERITMLLAEGEARIVLTQPELARTIPWPADVEVIPVDRHDCDPDVGLSAPRSPAQPNDLAYVIFTSGSTGVPKGVMIDHRGALNTVVDVNRRFGVGPGDRVLGLSALGFDLSVYDIFGVLGAGGTLVLPERSREKDSLHWVELVERHGVTIWNTVPALAQLFVDELIHVRGADAGCTLRLVMMSGDWIPLQLPARLRMCCPGALLVSLGGATEASIWSIAHIIDRVDDAWTSIPYGRPLDNQRFHVLGDDLSPCPDWVDGKLYIAGVGLAQGYWRDEQKTRTSFFEHPVTGERLYTTGDLGRYWPDGTIEFLGREDTQVKVHGHRIELGEIEAVLVQHEQVAAAAVTAPGQSADRRLVAYVVPAGQRRDATASDGEALITDPIQRTAFKLAEPGLRRLPEGTPMIALPHPVTDQTGAPSVRLAISDGFGVAGRLDPSALGTDVISAQRWGHWLNCVAQVPVDDHPIPKRYYPSAGSLYPVQLYVCVREDAVEGTPAGCYYYDPSAHTLLRLGPLPAGLPTDSAFSIFLVAAKQAIEPLYGALADRFCRLEAGHIISLLASAGPEHGIAVAGIDLPENVALRDALRLDDQHQLLACCAGGSTCGSRPHVNTTLRAIARQSYREFLGERFNVGGLIDLLAETPDEGPALYVYLRPGATGGESGYFLFDRRQRRLVGRADADEGLMKKVYAHENRGVHESSAFSLYLVGGSTDDGEVIAAGRLGQALVSLAPQHELGLCPIGNLAFTEIRSRLNLTDAEVLLYSFEGGAISVEQTQQWPVETSSSAGDEFEDLRRFLAARLPAYMVPSKFVSLERLPLNQNGKVDRKALPKVNAWPARNAFTPPGSDTERAVAGIWADMLQVKEVGIHDNFFDLGGNSLSAIRIISAIRTTFPADAGAVSLEAFFRNPTVNVVAALIDLSRDARLLESNRLGMMRDGSDIEEGVI